MYTSWEPVRMLLPSPITPNTHRRPRPSQPSDCRSVLRLKPSSRFTLIWSLGAAPGIAGIYTSLASVGRALNREQEAAKLVDALRERERAVRRRVAGKPVVNVLMPIWYDPLVTIGKDAYITDLIEIAGGHSVTSDVPQEWPEISLEAALARAPDALLLVRGSKMSVEILRTRPGWLTMPAVRNNRIYYVDERIESPSPVALDALEELAKQFHP